MSPRIPKGDQSGRGRANNAGIQNLGRPGFHARCRTSIAPEPSYGGFGCVTVKPRLTHQISETVDGWQIAQGRIGGHHEETDYLDGHAG